jgi:hypothetical protein
MNAAELFAVDLLNIVENMIEEKLTVGGRPDFDAIDARKPMLSTGETRIVDQAVAAWRGTPGSLIVDLGRLDTDTRTKVVEAFDRALFLGGIK